MGLLKKKQPMQDLGSSLTTNVISSPTLYSFIIYLAFCLKVSDHIDVSNNHLLVEILDVGNIRYDSFLFSFLL